MKAKVIVLMACCLGLFLVAHDVCSAQSTTPCVPQGQYAIQLASQLGLGTFKTAQQAIDALTRAEITPLGGWKITDCVTGTIINQINNAAVRASQKKLVKLPPAKAQDAVGALSQSLNLPLPTVLPTAALGPVPGAGFGAAATPPQPIQQRGPVRPPPGSPSR